MVVYEVNLVVQADIHDAWRAWIGPHMQELIALDGFEDAAIYQIESEDGGAAFHYTVQYRLANRAALDAYFRDHALRLREDGIARFGDRFSATRRIYSPL